jgi:hypothetical protein
VTTPETAVARFRIKQMKKAGKKAQSDVNDTDMMLVDGGA